MDIVASTWVEEKRRKESRENHRKERKWGESRENHREGLSAEQQSKKDV